MSYSPPTKTNASPKMGVIVDLPDMTKAHLVEANGVVVCKCSLRPLLVTLVENTLITPEVAACLCKESLSKYKEMTR